MSDAARAPSGGNGWSLVPLLSVQLLLLAFFILLTSISKFEDDRSHAVLASVQQAFTTIDLDQSGNLGSSGTAAVTRRVEGQLGDLAASLVALTHAPQADETGAVRLDLSAEAVFRPDEPAVSPAGRRFLRDLTRILGGLAPVYRYDLTVLLSTSATDRYAAARIATLAGGLIENGMPARAFSAGLGGVEAGRITFVVRLLAGDEAARP
jgi:biopolymer transport protein ExbD